MTATRDPDQLIRAFLEEGRTELPDRAYDAVRSQIDRTHQRVVIGPWREPRMPTLARFGVAVAAILIVGVVGMNLVGSGPIAPAGSPSPTSTSGPVASPIPSPVPSPLTYRWPEPLAAGSYTTTLAWDVPFTTTFSVPAGWQGKDVEIRKDPTMLVGFLLVDGVYADPCTQKPLEPKLGGSISELAETVALVPGIDATPAVPVSFAGASGLYVELEVDAAPTCALGTFALWDPAFERITPGKPTGGPGPWPAWLPHHRVWILDAAGDRYVIDAAWSDGASQADLAELQAIIDSIRLDVPAVAPAADCTVTLVDTAKGGNPLVAPYVVTLGSSLSELLGPVPVPLPSLPRPLVQVDFRVSGDGWTQPGAGSFRPGAGLTGPTGTEAGFATSTPVNGFQGSFVLTAPGSWLAELTGVNAACPHTFLIEARSP